MANDYADQAARIASHAADISVYCAIWSLHDDSRPCAAERRAASDAMTAIDKAIAELYRLRERLVGDIRQSDDKAAARVDQMLAASKEARA